MSDPKRRSLRIFLFGTGGTSNASARTRAFAYQPYLEAEGLRMFVGSYVYHRHRYMASKRGIWRKIWLELYPLRALLRALQARVWWFHRLRYAPWQARLGKALGKRIVYDVDDAVYLTPWHETTGVAQASALDNPVNREHCEWILKRADVVLVSGEELAKFARQFHSDVRILPSVVSRVAEGPSPGSNPPVIGWVGAPENLRYIGDIEDALVRLQAERPDLEVWLITSRLSDPPPRFRHRFIPWSMQAEAEFIPQFTVGIAPLHDDPWCRAKMNFKAIVYMAHGVPAVVSPVGLPLSEFEKDKSVSVAISPEEWYLCLKGLLDNPNRRNEMAAAALSVIRNRFSAEARASEFADAIKG
jgi:glycosyltransferase involved in cell wall biosynthesis